MRTYAAAEEEKTLRVKITDEKQQPVFGVYVVHPQEAMLLATSDMDGECMLRMTLLEQIDTLQFQGMGYISQRISVSDLRQHPVVCLKELKYELSEVSVRAIPTERILKTAMERLKKMKASRIPLCRYYGPAQYEKITQCRDTVVEYRREYGYYFTSGDVVPYNVWDKTFRSYIVPEYVARSFNLTVDGQDTLVPVFMTNKNVRLDIGTRKIFTLNRAVQLFGPLFNGRKHYDIRPLESDSADYVFSFKTISSAYPEKIRISCKGTFAIDREELRLKRMDFDYIDYQLLRQILLSSQRKTASPFSTRASLTFDCDSSGQTYIRSCHQVTTWKYDLGEDFILIEQPSRDLPGMNRLVEEEAFYCYDYRPLRKELQTPKMLTQIHLAQRYPAGKYAPEVLDPLPYLLDVTPARKDLGRYMKLEDQFRMNSDKPYYPENYILGSDIDQKERAIYLKELAKARKYLFKEAGLRP